MAAHDRLQVKIADGAAGEAAELRMDQPIGIGNRNRVAGDADQFTLGDDASKADHGGLAHRSCSLPGDEARFGRDSLSPGH